MARRPTSITPPPIIWDHFDPKKIKHPTWLINDLIPESSTCCIYGAPNTGKSFIVLSMALSIALGMSWLGMPTRNEVGKIKEPGKVVYILAESPDSLHRRIAGWLDHNDLNRNEGQRILENRLYIPKVSNLKLDTPEGYDSLVKEINRECPDVALIIFDPLVSFMNGDENKAGDTQNFINVIRNLTEVYKESNCSVMLVHHSGKDYARGERGSSALRGGVDTHLRLTSNRLEVEKQRDAGKIPDIYLDFITAVETIDQIDRDLGKVVVRLDAPAIKNRKGKIRITEAAAPPLNSDQDPDDIQRPPPPVALKEVPTRMQKRTMEKCDAIFMAMNFLRKERSGAPLNAGDIFLQMKKGEGFLRFKGKRSGFYTFIKDIATPMDGNPAPVTRVGRGLYQLAPHIIEELEKSSVHTKDVPSQGDPSRQAEPPAPDEGQEP